MYKEEVVFIINNRLNKIVKELIEEYNSDDSLKEDSLDAKHYVEEHDLVEIVSNCLPRLSFEEIDMAETYLESEEFAKYCLKILEV